MDVSNRHIEIESMGRMQGQGPHEVPLSSFEKGPSSEHPLVTRVPRFSYFNLRPGPGGCRKVRESAWHLSAHRLGAK